MRNKSAHGMICMMLGASALMGFGCGGDTTPQRPPAVPSCVSAEDCEAGLACVEGSCLTPVQPQDMGSAQDLGDQQDLGDPPDMGAQDMGAQDMASPCMEVLMRMVSPIQANNLFDARAPKQAVVPAMSPLSFGFEAKEEPASFEWSMPERPATSQAMLHNNGPVFRRLTPDVEGDYTIALSALDAQGNGTCTPQHMRLRVTPALKEESLQVQLAWHTIDGSPAPDEGDSGVDLYLLPPGATSWDEAVSPQHLTRDWGAPGEATDDPHMSAVFPMLQHISHPSPSADQPGTFRVVARYRDARGRGQIKTSVHIFQHHREVVTFQSKALSEGEVWAPATIELPSHEVRAIALHNAYLNALPALDP